MDATLSHSEPLGRSRSDFEVFYADRSDEVYRTLAVTLRNSELAREATDEAMVRAYSRWSKVRRFSNPAGWVYRVAYNWALDRLRRSEARAVVVLRVVHDWSEGDVAYALDIPVGTVKSRLSRALKTLRIEVEDE